MIGQFKDDLKNLHEQIMASKFAAQANRLVEAAGGNKCDSKQEIFDSRVRFFVELDEQVIFEISQTFSNC